MSAPGVTVVMAAHNAGKYIRLAIDSLLKQTLHDFELIVVDDASSDESLSVVRAYSDPRIQIIENSVQKGVSWSRNRGLERARGKYIAILDADDLALPDRLRFQSDYLDATPEVSLVGSNFETIDEEGNVTCRDRIQRDPLTLRWLLLFGNCFVHSTVMFRRAGIEAWGGYDETMPSGEDYDLYTRFAGHSQVGLLDRVLCQWRIHSASLSNQDAIESHKPLWAKATIKSVYLQTSQPIDDDVASCLMRNISRAGKDRQTALKAFDVIVNCFNSLSASHQTRAEVRLLLLLAIEELLRVAKLNPGSWRYAFSRVAKLLSRHDPLLTLHPATIKILLRATLPGNLTVKIGRLRRGLEPSSRGVVASQPN